MSNLPNPLVLHPYIARELTRQDKWATPTEEPSGYNRHLLPKLMDPGWQTAFTLADTEQRTKLAHAWLWSYIVKAAYDELDFFGKATDWCIERNAAWLQTIEPYVQVFSDDRDRHMIRTSASLLYRGGMPHSAWKRKLWFGTDAERQATLLEIYNDDRLIIEVPQGKTMHNRIWEIASLPTSTFEHKMAGATIGVLTGYDSSMSTPALNEEYAKWMQLGRFAYAGAPRFANEEKNMCELVAFIRAQPLELALPIFAQLIEKTKSSYEKGSGFTYSVPGLGKQELNMDNQYDVCTHWFPTLSEKWDVARTLGLSLDEATKYALSVPVQQLERVNLPNDMESFEL